MKLTEREKQVAVDLSRSVQQRLCVLFEPIDENEGQWSWFGRYAEFNHVYDRGTKFDPMTGDCADFKMVSMPLVVKR